MNAGIGLRPADAADDEFCFQLHKAAMGGYIAEVWGWDEGDQREFHSRAFNPARWQIVTAGGIDIGMIDVEYRDDQIYLARIEIHPDRQGRGIGSHLIRNLIEDADRHGVGFTLDVLAVNTRARSLYRRLGMVDLARHGEGGIKIAMRCER